MFALVVVTAAMVAVNLGAAAGVFAAEPTDPVPGFTILSGSVLGIVLLLGLFGWIWFKPAVESLKERMVKAENQRDDLVKVYETDVIPILTELKDKVVPLLLEIKAELTAQRPNR